MPAAIQEIRVGDIGTQLELEIQENSVPLNVSTNTTMDITLKRPDNTAITRAGTFQTSGADGKIVFTTIAGDLTIEGTYKIQAFIVLPAWTGYSSIGEFEVHANLG